MEAVTAYYNGRAFVPTMPTHAKCNQRAIVTILDDSMPELPVETSRAATLALAQKMRGMFAGTEMSSERFAAEKEAEFLSRTR
jgi:hypothetical protein